MPNPALGAMGQRRAAPGSAGQPPGSRAAPPEPLRTGSDIQMRSAALHTALESDCCGLGRAKWMRARACDMHSMRGNALEKLTSCNPLLATVKANKHLSLAEN